MSATNSFSNNQFASKLTVLFCIVSGLSSVLRAQETNVNSEPAAQAASNATPLLQIKAGEVKANVSPVLYGLMTEEINFSYEGGLYGELIRNRTFKANAIQQPIASTNYNPAIYYPVKIAVTNSPKYWSAINASITLDTNNPLNEMLNVSCKVDVQNASKNSPAGIANAGYWGIPVRPNTT